MTTDSASLQEKIQEQINFQKKYTFEIEKELTPGWADVAGASNSRLFKNDGSLNFHALENFRRSHIFCIDNGPYTDYSSLNPAKWWKNILKSPLRESKMLLKQHLNGTYRGQKKIVDNYLKILKQEEGAFDLLKKYDVSKTAGNPFWYEEEGIRFNGRWLHHIYFLNLFNKTIGPLIRAEKNTVFLDLGCSYGLHSYLLKSEYVGSNHVCVDLPDQLILTHYFLKKSLPNAKIATIADFYNKEKIDRDFIRSFDFVLVPPTHFSKLESGSVDVFTNYISLGEMQRKWFDHYLQSAVFKTVKYFSTGNRFISSPYFQKTHSNGLTIRDYPLDDFKTLWFDINPFFFQYIVERKKFFYDVKPLSSAFFTFIGQRKDL